MLGLTWRGVKRLLYGDAVLCDWQGEGEGASRAHLALHPDAPTEGLHQPPRDVEAQAEALTALASSLGAVVALEQARDLVGRNAGATVGH